ARFVGGDSFDPTWATELREMVQTLELQDRIHLAGATTALDAEYQQADLFVLASRYEGYGMVFAEAIACGLPVIGTKVGAAAELIPVDAGILVPPDDVAALTTALAQVLGNSRHRRHLQQGARAAASSLPQWGQSANK